VFLGVDGGGTKTALCLVTEDGRLAAAFVAATGVDSLVVAVGTSHAMTESVARVDLGSMHPVAQTRIGDPEVLGDLGDRSITAPGHSHDVRAELLRMNSRHDRHPSSEDPRPHRSSILPR